jgi:hypothetical protein
MLPAKKKERAVHTYDTPVAEQSRKGYSGATYVVWYFASRMGVLILLLSSEATGLKAHTYVRQRQKADILLVACRLSS